MDRVLNNIQYQCCTTIVQNSNYRSRTIIEHILLLIALCGFGIVILTHSTFVLRQQQQQYHHSPTNYTDTDTTNDNSSVYHNNNNYHRRSNIPLTCLASIDGFDINADLTHIVVLNQRIATNSTKIQISPFKQQHTRSSFILHKSNNLIQKIPSDEDTCSSPDDIYKTSLLENLVNNQKKSTKNMFVYYTYSKIESYVYMSQRLRLKHSINEQYVFIYKNDIYCFGEPFVQNLLFYLLPGNDFDTVLINWLLGLEQQQQQQLLLQRQQLQQGNHPQQIQLDKEDDDDNNEIEKNATGFIYNPRSGTMLDLGTKFYVQYRETTESDSSNNNVLSPLLVDQLSILAGKVWIVIKTLFVYGITTTVVHYTLYETQQLMFTFTNQLQLHIRTRRPIYFLVIQHLIQCIVFVPIMIGTMFFLFEIYSTSSSINSSISAGGMSNSNNNNNNNQKLLGFIILSLIWISEVFIVIGLRTKQATYYFPRIFFLLFALFHFYYFSFPHGFSYTAFITLICSVLHTMVFFIHRFEIPAILTRQQHERRQQQLQQLNYNLLSPYQQQAPAQISAASRSTSNSSRNEHNDLAIRQQLSSESNASENSNTHPSGMNYFQQGGQLQHGMTRSNNMSSASLQSTSTTSTVYRQALLQHLNDDNIAPSNTIPYERSIATLQPRRMANSSSFDIQRWTDAAAASSTFDDDVFTDDVMINVAAQAAAAVSSLNTNNSFQQESTERKNDEEPLFCITDQVITVDYSKTDEYDNYDNDTDNDDDKTTTASLLPMSPVSVSNPALMMTTATTGTRITAATSSEFELDLVGMEDNTTPTSDDNNDDNSTSPINRSLSFIQENETSTLQSILLSSRDSFFSQGTYS